MAEVRESEVLDVGAPEVPGVTEITVRVTVPSDINGSLEYRTNVVFSAGSERLTKPWRLVSQPTLSFLDMPLIVLPIPIVLGDFVFEAFTFLHFVMVLGGFSLVGAMVVFEEDVLRAVSCAAGLEQMSATLI